MTACNIVVSTQVVGSVQSEIQFKEVLAFKTSEVAIVELRKNNYYVGIGVRGFLECELKGFVVASTPGDLDARPLLGDSPFWLQEEMSSVDYFVFSKKIIVGNPLDVVSLNTFSIRAGFGACFGKLRPPQITFRHGFRAG